MLDVNVLAMYFGWFALAFVPTIYLLQWVRLRHRRNDPECVQPAADPQPAAVAANKKPAHSKSTAAPETTSKSSGKQQPHNKRGQAPKRGGAATSGGDKQFSHPWHKTTLKGHNGQLFDMNFSPDGEYLASCDEDRTVLLWNWSDIDGKRRCQRINIEFDHAVKVVPHPIKPELFIHKSQANCIERYDLKRQAGDSVTVGPTFPVAHPLDADIVGFGIATNGSYLMSCSSRSEFVIWSAADQRVLAKVDTSLGNNYSAKVSLCGRFVAACGFSPDVKVWQVKFKAGKYVDTKIAFNLSGHSSGIFDIAFDQTSSRVATVSKDGTWKLYNTNIEFDHGELPVCLLTGKYTSADFATPSKIAISGNGDVVAIANGRTVQLYSTVTGKRDATIEAIVPSEIVAVAFTPCGRFLLVAGGKVIRVVHNVTGYRVAVVRGRAKLAETTNSTARDRIQLVIDENERLVATYDAK